MPFFKYYRPDFYFEKAIRYNELYFSQNTELNDPHDLKATFYFEDSIDLWKRVLCLSPKYESWDLRLFLKVDDHRLASSLNDLFKGLRVDSIKGSIKKEMDSRRKSLARVFLAHAKDRITHPHIPDSYMNLSAEQLTAKCTLLLTTLLLRAFDHRFNSTSFSKNALEPMMWAHYADGFKGCVIIYDVSTSEKFELRNNFMARHTSPYEVLEVKYVDDEKLVPILASAVGSQSSAQQAFLQKNTFWSYEAEYRVFTSEQIDPHRLVIAKDEIKNNRARILHHFTGLIAGVIFGPRCDDNFKERVKHTLRDNRFHNDGAAFYALNTELTHRGEVVVSSAAAYLCNNLRGGSMPLRGDQLQDLLGRLGIARSESVV
jgi:hypothetical protein